MWLLDDIQREKTFKLKLECNMSQTEQKGIERWHF